MPSTGVSYRVHAGKPTPNQAPAHQHMAAPAPVGTAAAGVPAAAPPAAPVQQQQEGILGRMAHAFGN